MSQYRYITRGIRSTLYSALMEKYERVELLKTKEAKESLRLMRTAREWLLDTKDDELVEFPDEEEEFMV